MPNYKGNEGADSFWASVACFCCLAAYLTKFCAASIPAPDYSRHREVRLNVGELLTEWQVLCG